MTNENQQPIEGSDPYSTVNPTNPNFSGYVDQVLDKDAFELADPVELSDFNSSLSQRIEQIAGTQGIVKSLNAAFLNNDAPLNDDPLEELVEVVELAVSRNGETPYVIKDVTLRLLDGQETEGIRDVTIHYDPEEVFPVVKINGFYRNPLGENRISKDEAESIKSRLYPILNPVTERPIEQMSANQRYFLDALRIVDTFVSGEGFSEDIEAFFDGLMNGGEAGIIRTRSSEFDATATDAKGRQFDLHHYRSEGHGPDGRIVVEDGTRIQAYKGKGRQDEQLLLKYFNDETKGDNVDDILDAVPDDWDVDENDHTGDRKTARFYDEDPYIPIQGMELSADERDKRAALGRAVTEMLGETRREILGNLPDIPLTQEPEEEPKAASELSPFEVRIIDDKNRLAQGVDSITVSKLKRLRNELAFIVSQ